MTVFESNVLKDGKRIINNLPEKVKTDLLEFMAIYYSNKYLAKLNVNNKMYDNNAIKTANILYGYITCLESTDTINNNDNYRLKNFIDILAKQNDIVNNSSDIAIYDNLLNYFK